MKLTLDNNQRIFLIERKGFSTRNFFCNLHHIPAIIREELESNDEYTISEFWDRKFKRLYKKRLNEYFAANKIDFKL